MSSRKGAFVIVADPASKGYVPFLSSLDGAWFLCEVQSHKYHPPVEGRLTEPAVSFLEDCGFRWPFGVNNFARFTFIGGETDLLALADLAAMALCVVFGCADLRAVTIDVRIPVLQRRSGSRSGAVNRYFLDADHLLRMGRRPPLPSPVAPSGMT